MKVYVLKEWKGSGINCGWFNTKVVSTLDEAESYVEHDRENRDYDEYDLDVSNLSYNQIFGERK